MNVGSLFSGIGMLDYGLHLAGFEHSWLCEVDPWRRERLAQRFPGAPIFEDVRAVGAANAPRVDLIAGGFPCKGASTAGKREGFGHPETVLWREMSRVIGELRPRYVLIENVANLLALHGGAVWGEVLGDLASLGFDVVWDCLPAAAVGAPHRRDRVFAAATYADRAGRGQRGGTEPVGAQHPSPKRGGAAPTDPGGGPAQLRGERRELHGPSGCAEGEGDKRQRVRDAAADRPEVASDSPSGGRQGAWTEWSALGGAAGDRAVAVEWGEYEPAIRRWETVHGPAPEPLVRRVDDGNTRRVERSRLSALGDGVCVHVAYVVGLYIQHRERERVGSYA